MSTVIQILGLANGQSMGGFEGQYVKDYTPDGNEGRGDLVLTPRVEQAKRYRSKVEATRDWKRVSATHPTRADGKPNRPMSAFSVALEELDDFDGAA